MVHRFLRGIGQGASTMSGPGWQRTVKLKMLPLPTSLRTVMSPPWSRQSCRQIASPSPVPP